MKRIIAGMTIAICVQSLFALTVKSPNGSVEGIFETNKAGRLTYSVKLNGKQVLLPSPMGVIVNGLDLGKGVVIGKQKTRSFHETYPFWGNRKMAVNSFNENVFEANGATDKKLRVIVEARVFDDGVAFRYRFPQKGARKITGEETSWVLPQNAKIWYQTNLHSYEGVFRESRIEQVGVGQRVGLPVTVQLADQSAYLLLTEANLFNYTDLGVKVRKGNRLSAFYHADLSGFSQTGDPVTPWRVTIAARDLNTFSNSDMLKNLCPPPSKEVADLSFVKPGRCIWQWLASGAPRYRDQKSWYDKTKSLGFEYYLIDDGWRGWRDGALDQWACLKKVIAYGNSIGVKTAIWVNSNEVFNQASRRSYLQKVKDSGAIGVKIDFIPSSNYHWTQWYEDTLVDCAKVGLFVDFHGSVKPSGRERTWPHELSREGIRGHEWHVTRYKRVQSFDHDTILPFNRLIQGRADYTPVVFEKKQLIHFTWPRELAQGIIFSSPFLCFGDYPANYLKSPMADVIKSLPAVYDETRCLPGSEIGTLVAFAKRSGDTWFIAVENADVEKRLTINFDFLDAGEYRMISFSDVDRYDGCERSEKNVTSKESVTLTIRPGGGWVARLTKK